MKLTIQRGLFKALVDRVEKALESATSPEEPGQYLMLEAKKDGLSAYVVRKDLVAKATIETALAGPLMKIEREGACAMPGKRAHGYISLGDASEELEFSFEEMTKEEKKAKKEEAKGDKKPDKQVDAFDDDDEAKDAAEEEEAGAVIVGRAVLTYEGHNKRKQRHQINCVDLVKRPKIEADEATEVSLSGKAFARLMRAIGIAAGKSTMSQDYASMRLQVTGDKLQLAAANGIQCGIAELEKSAAAPGAFRAKKDICWKLPYELVDKARSILGEDLDVRAYDAPGDKRFVLMQEIQYAQQKVGDNVFSIALSDRFSKVDDKIGKTDFRYRCKAKTELLKVFCEKLNLCSKAKTIATFNPEANEFVAAKKDALADDDISLPVYEVEGGPLELEISSHHLAAGMAIAEKDFVELWFSGKTSLAKQVLGEGLTHYFVPFTEA